LTHSSSWSRPSLFSWNISTECNPHCDDNWTSWHVKWWTTHAVQQHSYIYCIRQYERHVD